MWCVCVYIYVCMYGNVVASIQEGQIRLVGLPLYGWRHHTVFVGQRFPFLFFFFYTFLILHGTAITVSLFKMIYIYICLICLASESLLW